MNLLVSYAHIQGVARWEPVLELWASTDLPLMIDSGAFSAAFSGREIDHASYIAFCNRLTAIGKRVECIQLDAPRNPVKTAANLREEYAAGLRTIPVHLSNASVDEFAAMVQTYGTRICMAGGQNAVPDAYVRRIARRQAAVNSRASIHALGFTPGLWPLKSGAYSFDSTSWLAALKWGTVNFYDSLAGITQIAYKDLKASSLKALPREMRNTFAMSGVTEADLRGERGGRTQHAMTSFFSADAWLRMATRYERSKKRFFFAAVQPWMLTQLLMAMLHQQHRGICWAGIKAEVQPLMSTLSGGQLDLPLIEQYIKRARDKWRRTCAI